MTIEGREGPQSVINTKVGKLPVEFPAIQNNIMDLFLLNGKAAIVTGGARGIGFVISEGYCQAGLSKLAILDYNKCDETVEELRQKYPKCQVESVQVDVRKKEQIYGAVDKVHEMFGHIDIFVANAGIPWVSGGIIELENNEDEFDNVMDVDVKGVFYCAKAVGKIFRQQGKGSLIFTASMSAHIVNVPNYQAPYNAAKAAVLHMSRSLAVEWVDFARVNTVSPGYMATEISDFLPREIRDHWCQLIPKGREGVPKELAGAYLYLGSDAASYTTGADIKVDGGYTAP